jgi:hypothetical protein
MMVKILQAGLVITLWFFVMAFGYGIAEGIMAALTESQITAIIYIAGTLFVVIIIGLVFAGKDYLNTRNFLAMLAQDDLDEQMTMVKMMQMMGMGRSSVNLRMPGGGRQQAPPTFMFPQPAAGAEQGAYQDAINIE